MLSVPAISQGWWVALGIVMIAAHTAAESPCQAGWIYSAEGTDGPDGKCYYIWSTKETFNKSVELCQQKNATIASIATFQEHDMIIQHLMSEDTYWIGLYKVDEEDADLHSGWMWLDGTPYTWASWFVDQTVEPAQGQRYVYLDVVPWTPHLPTMVGFHWWSDDGTRKCKPICEKPATSSPGEVMDRNSDRSDTEGYPDSFSPIPVSAFLMLIFGIAVTCMYKVKLIKTKRSQAHHHAYQGLQNQQPVVVYDK